MSDNTNIYELLDKILESGCTAEEACADHPELLDVVRQRLQQMRAIKGELDSLLPNSAPTAPLTPGVVPTGLPAVPGYEVQAVLGRGGMGIVYKAKHLKLHRLVALKMLLTGSHSSQQDLLRFVREAEAAAGLRHPNIVQVYDVGESEGRPYYTMEYVEGENLAQKFAKVPQPVRDAAKTIATLAQAVDFAHRNGVIHRDLKPANILLTAEGLLKITDFGLARRLDGDGDLTRTGARIGTPSYMAPEQVMGLKGAVGPAVDIHALGTMLYEMLVGQPPFRGATISEVERRLLSEEPQSPSRWNEKVPRDLNTICLKCLEKEPARRYSTAGELAADLERFLRHEPILARPVGRTERLVRWVWYNPTVAALVVTALTLIGLVIGEGAREWALGSMRRAEHARLTSRLVSGIQLAQEERIPEARALLGRLGDGGFPDLRKRIDGAVADLNLVEELEALALRRVAASRAQDDRRFHKQEADRAYKEVFTKIGMGQLFTKPRRVAQQIRASNINRSLVAALDDWAVCAAEDQRRRGLLEVARQADPDSSQWRDRVRDPAKWSDPVAVSQFAETAWNATPSQQLLRTIGDLMDELGLDSVPFRQRMQREHANDFLANFLLGSALLESNPVESVRYYQAALAIRPATPAVYHHLGIALANSGRSDDAISHYREALQRDPRYAPAKVSLGELFLKDHQYEAAAGELRPCLELLSKADPQYPKVLEMLNRCDSQSSSSDSGGNSSR